MATEVAEGILAQGFEPTPSYAACSICDYRSSARRRSAELAVFSIYSNFLLVRSKICKR